MRGRAAGGAAVLLMLLAGCGSGCGSGSKADAKASPAPEPTTAADVDGDTDPGRRFTAAELKAALLPAAAIGPKATAGETVLGPFERHYVGGDWGTCEPGSNETRELARTRGASAGRTVSPFPGAVYEENPHVSESLASMSPAQASRYLELRRKLHDDCPVVTVDTEAAPVEEHHQAWKLPNLGDEAILETHRTTGGEEYDDRPYYEIEVRVGGVLVLVGAGPDKDLTLSSAAKAVERVRAELYEVS